MVSFAYKARGPNGAPVAGVIDAEDRQSALSQLTARGLFPTALDTRSAAERKVHAEDGAEAFHRTPTDTARGRISRKEITAFTREMATLINATIPIPAALAGLGEEEPNPALKRVILDLASFVRAGHSLSGAMESYPRLFPKLYRSMVEVGEESGALDKVLGDLADLLEHEDEVRGEVMAAVAYPCFVLLLGVVTTFVLLVFVLPRLFGMLSGMLTVMPLPTRILLEVSAFFQTRWPWILGGVTGAVLLVRWCLRTPSGALLWDTVKLRLPAIGGVFQASALGRFARTLGTLVENGVSLLAALEIARNTVGNRHYAGRIDQVALDTRGGDSLAVPLRKQQLFPATMVQMIAVGEETGRLDAMLLRVAIMQERAARGRSRTVISLLAPALILLVGALVGFIVIALLLPIFQMSQSLR